MKKNRLCGSKCVLLVLNKLNIKYKNINPNLYFITDIANTLKEYVDIDLYCYNSNLYTDYKLNKLPIKEAIQSIKKFEQYKTIKEIKLNPKKLIDELKDNYLILNVDSRIINNTKDNTGHYIVAELNNNIIKIYNPEKTRFVESTKTPQELINMMKNNGNWRIKIRRKYDKSNSI